MLKPGDTIGLVSPAGCVKNKQPIDQYKSTITAQLTALGFKVKFAPHWDDCWGYLAGTDQQRADDLNNMFYDPNIDGILANRGGWGCARILPLLDYESIAKNPKIFVGFSDITACINAIHQQTGLVTFHGPVGIDTWAQDSIDVEWTQKLLASSAGTVAGLVLTNDERYQPELHTITPGIANGTLVGGNLSVLEGIVDTKYVPGSYKNHILFLEDVGEPPYRIDRMLTQLQLSGVLSEISGFVWGICPNCDNGNQFDVATVLDQHIQPLGIPAYRGAMFGHIHGQYTLPLGIYAQLDATKFTITLLESS
eukprot:CAMPEP_0201553604 /NCGR_PEP_ID=MMETSP0173_2-20130828/31309_1 /ASSEMBLY_ACC=CAM_ASM_000268 /TAXON_ID=218659 /ORGANISM="Vexillifera sp., Strain DIVA3 564/2" /LENGTH=308 /DNA_ID=CAMNT_0047964505 /DNA_START=104 /DNA_END=1026 /DNA_ORIENTATION=+